MASIYERPMSLFTEPGQIIRLALADGFRFIVFIHGEKPELMPIDEPGVYDIDIPAIFAKGRYPVGVTTVDLAHVAIITKIPAHVVSDILDAAYG